VIQTLIVDDERLAREEMRYLLMHHEDIGIVGEAASGSEALEFVKESSPDLIMLDVQMPGMNGFQLIDELGERQLLPHVVMVTAYDEYAIRAFEVNAVDYLLKPVDEDRLGNALDRVRERMRHGWPTDEKFMQFVRQLAEGLQSANRTRPPKLSVRKGERHLLLNPADVTHAYILDGIVFLATADIVGITPHHTLEELERDLDPDTFWRVHRSYVVNLDHVTEIIPWQNGTYRLRLDDEKGTLIPLSRAQAKRMRKVLRW